MTEPVVVINELQELTSSLDTASKNLYRLETELHEALEAYDDIFNDLLCAFTEPYEEEGKIKRMPGEDVRNALITKQIRKEYPAEYGAVRRMRNELDRGEKRVKRIERQISAKQSILKTLQTEAQAIR